MLCKTDNKIAVNWNASQPILPLESFFQHQHLHGKLVRPTARCLRHMPQLPLESFFSPGMLRSDSGRTSGITLILKSSLNVVDAIDTYSSPTLIVPLFIVFCERRATR